MYTEEQSYCKVCSCCLKKLDQKIVVTLGTTSFLIYYFPLWPFPPVPYALPLITLSDYKITPSRNWRFFFF